MPAKKAARTAAAASGGDAPSTRGELRAQVTALQAELGEVSRVAHQAHGKCMLMWQCSRWVVDRSPSLEDLYAQAETAQEWGGVRAQIPEALLKDIGTALQLAYPPQVEAGDLHLPVILPAAHARARFF